MYVYFNVNFNVFFKLIKVHFLVSELYKYNPYSEILFINILIRNLTFSFPVMCQESAVFRCSLFWKRDCLWFCEGMCSVGGLAALQLRLWIVLSGHVRRIIFQLLSAILHAARYWLRSGCEIYQSTAVVMKRQGCPKLHNISISLRALILSPQKFWMYAGCVRSIRAEKLVCGQRFFETDYKIVPNNF